MANLRTGSLHWALAFANEEDGTAYRELEEIMAIEAEIDIRVQVQSG